MKFQDNFSELILISERPVTFYFEDGTELQMKIPNIIDTIVDLHIQRAIAIGSLSVTELKKHVQNFDFNSVWGLVSALSLLDRFKTEDVVVDMHYLLRFCFPQDFHIEKNIAYLGTIQVDDELFNRIFEIVQISACAKTFAEQNKFQIAKPQWLIDKENEIKRIKQQGKSTSQTENFNQITKIFIQLNYEFGYTFEELSAMNYFHIQLLQKYIPKIINYDIQKRAAAMGLTKKQIKYITD